MKNIFDSALLVVVATVVFSLNVAAQSEFLEEIIVTAQKRSQNIQDVPVAVTALSETVMANQNIFDITDLNRAIPSLNVVKGYNKATQTPISIRGIGTDGSQAAFEGSVGTYIDGIYRSRPGMALSTMLDIGRVEVLRGPQGTLFGKNMTAGAITMTSIAPSDEFIYGGEVTLGDYDRRHFMGYVSGALSDSIRSRFSMLSNQRDGFTDAYTGGEDYGNLNIQSYKFNLLWNVNDKLKINLIADYSDSDENCCFGNALNFNREGGLTQGPLGDYYLVTSQQNFNTPKNLLTLAPNKRINQNNINPFNENTDQGVVFAIDYSASKFDVKSITGYRGWEYTSFGDFDFSPVDIGELLESYDVDSFSQEFNLSGNVGDKLDYVTGLYYAREQFEQHRVIWSGSDQAGIWEIFWPVRTGLPALVLEGLFNAESWAQDGLRSGDVLHDLESETLAIFAHTTTQLTESLFVVAAARYSKEEKTMDRKNLLFSDIEDYATYLQNQHLGAYLLGANLTGPDISNLKYNDHEWTYDFKLQWFINDNTQLYGGYSRGFKAGGISVDPEAGGGQPWGLNSPILLALAGIGNGSGFADTNDPTYKPEYIDAYEIGIKSDYLEGRARTNAALFYSDIKDLQLSTFTGFGFQVLNASSATVEGMELENSFVVTDNLRLDLALTYVNSEYNEGTPSGIPAGRELNNAPAWAGTVNASYGFRVTDQLEGYLNANWSYRGKRYIDLSPVHPSYSILGLQLGVRDINTVWDVRIWCNNCMDKQYSTFSFNSPFFFRDDTLGSYQSQFLGPPQTYGVTLRLNF